MSSPRIENQISPRKDINKDMKDNYNLKEIENQFLSLDDGEMIEGMMMPQFSTPSRKARVRVKDIKIDLASLDNGLDIDFGENPKLAKNVTGTSERDTPFSPRGGRKKAAPLDNLFDGNS